MIGLVVAQHRPHDVKAAAGEGQHGLGVAFPLSAFAVVVDPRCGVGADCVVRCPVTGAQQPSVVAAGSFEIAADASGVTWDRGQPSDGREAIGVAECSDAPPVAARNSAPRITPKPGMLRMISAWRCRRNRSSIIASVSPVSVSRVITSSASRATIAAASCCPGTTVCWDLAASIAAAATASALRALRLRNQVASRAAPARRSPSGGFDTR